jgi:hypothetical protein
MQQAGVVASNPGLEPPMGDAGQLVGGLERWV